MHDNTFCPSRDQLAAMASGQLPGNVAQELAQHAASCSHCAKVLQSLNAQTAQAGKTRPLGGATTLGDTGPVDFSANQDVPLTSDTGNWADPIHETAQPSGPPATGTTEPTIQPPSDPRNMLGDYEVIARLGAGGMGEVYKALHRRMDRVVAMKVLSRNALSTPAAVERFQREVKAAARLVHPNIVAAYDAGEQDDVHYLVMEYVEGSDLYDVVEQNGPLPLDRVLDYTIQAARGLEHAHKKGIIHRDIKPANLILDHEGTVKVLDMGLAVIQAVEAIDDSPEAQRVTQTGMIIGTASYMAPEQAKDMKRADHRADIYSLGCSMFYLLTGRDPYEGDTFMNMLLAHREQPIPSLCAAVPGLPPQMDNIFRGMVAKSVHERYQSMTDVIADLEMLQAQVHDPSSAAPRRPDPYQQAAVADTFPSEAAAVARGALVDTIVSLGLMTGDQIRHVLSTLPQRPANDDELAQILVQGGHISVYQSAVLTQGDPNELVFGNYLLVEMLAEHEGRALFECRHRETGDRAAIKIYARDAGDYNKLQAASKLAHANLVRVLEVGQTDQCDYVISEFYNAGEITRRIRNDGPMRLRDALRAVISICEPLSLAHEQGLPHGNVSPANVLIGDRDVLKLADLGWSTYRPPASMESAEARDASRIDPAEIDYTAPELLDGSGQPNARSDIYGLGGLLYYLATGTTPRLKKTLVDDEDPIPQLSRMVDGSAPKILDHVFERMVAKDKDKRFGSVREVIAALQGVLDPGRLSSELKQAAAPAGPQPEAAVEAEAETPFWKTNGGSTALIGTGLLVAIAIGMGLYHVLSEPVSPLAWGKAVLVACAAAAVWAARHPIGTYCKSMPFVVAPLFGLLWALFYWGLALPRYESMEGLVYHGLGMMTTLAFHKLVGIYGMLILGGLVGLVMSVGGMRGAGFMASGVFFPILAFSLWASGYSPEEMDRGAARFPRDQGTMLIDGGDIDRALKYYSFEIDTAQRYTAANHYQRGRCHLIKGDYDKAIEDLNTAAELQPGYYETHMMRATAYKKTGKYEEALKDYNRTLEINPDAKEAYAGRAEVNLELKNYEQAVADYNVALKLEPSSSQLYVNRAKALEKLGRADEAAADRQKAKILLESALKSLEKPDDESP